RRRRSGADAGPWTGSSCRSPRGRSAEVVERPLAAQEEGLLAEGDVDRPPADVGAAVGVLDEALVAGAAAGLLPREGRQGAGGGDGPALLADRQLVQPGRGQVAVDLVGAA